MLYSLTLTFIVKVKHLLLMQLLLKIRAVGGRPRARLASTRTTPSRGVALVSESYIQSFNFVSTVDPETSLAISAVGATLEPTGEELQTSFISLLYVFFQTERTVTIQPLPTCIQHVCLQRTHAPLHTHAHKDARTHAYGPSISTHLYRLCTTHPVDRRSGRPPQLCAVARQQSIAIVVLAYLNAFIYVYLVGSTPRQQRTRPTCTGSVAGLSQSRPASLSTRA